MNIDSEVVIPGVTFFVVFTITWNGTNASVSYDVLSAFVFLLSLLLSVFLLVLSLDISLGLQGVFLVEVPSWLVVLLKLVSRAAS